MKLIVLSLVCVLALGACSSNTPLSNNPEGYHSVHND